MRMCERKYRGDAGGSGFFPFPLFYFIFLTQLGLGRVFYTLKRDQLFFSWRFFIWEVITRCVPRKTNLLNWFNIYTSKSLADCLNTDHPPPHPPLLPPQDRECKLNVYKTSRTSFELLMYVHFPPGSRG